MTAFLLITSVAGWSLWLYERRRAVRDLQRQSVRHIRQMSDAFMRGYFSGLKATSHKRQKLQDWQEAQR